jgi:hypothetical protein
MEGKLAPPPPAAKKKEPKRLVCAAERAPVKDSHQTRLGGGAGQTMAVQRDENGVAIVPSQQNFIIISNCRSPRPPWELVDLENSLTPAEQYLCELRPPPTYAPPEVRSQLTFVRVLASADNCYYSGCRRVVHTKRLWSLCDLCKQECDRKRAPPPPTPAPAKVEPKENAEEPVVSDDIVDCADLFDCQYDSE